MAIGGRRRQTRAMTMEVRRRQTRAMTIGGRRRQTRAMTMEVRRRQTRAMTMEARCPHSRAVTLEVRCPHTCRAVPHVGLAVPTSLQAGAARPAGSTTPHHRAHALRRHRRHRHASGIAEVLHTLGYSVQGSDIADSANVQRLRESGIPVAIGHDAANLGNARVVVVSTAVKRDNPEVMAARARFIPVVYLRRDAGRTDAPEMGHRRRRHAWQRPRPPA